MEEQIKQKIFEKLCREAKLGEEKRELIQKRDEIAVEKLKTRDVVAQVASKDMICEELELLREKYVVFSKDLTRVSSMRVMAATFAKELEEILKK